MIGLMVYQDVYTVSMSMTCGRTEDKIAYACTE